MALQRNWDVVGFRFCRQLPKPLSLAILLLTVGPSTADQPQDNFGNRQIAQLLEDRSALASVIPAEHPVLDWMKRQFAGEATGQRICWDFTPPTSGRRSEYVPRFEISSSPACIRLSASKRISPRDKLFLVVFELVNIRNSKQVHAWAQAAGNDEVEFDEYFRGKAKLEYEACLETKRLMSNWFPESDSPSPGAWERWLRDLPIDFDSYFEKKKQDESYRKHYQRQYNMYQAIGRGYRESDSSHSNSSRHVD